MSPIVDLIIRIKNGYMSGRERIESPYSRFREDVLSKLKRLKYISDYTVTGDKVKHVSIELSYDEELQPAVNDVKIISKPGQRMYTAAKDLKPVLSGMGYAILSTPDGILTNIEAKKNNVGGELLFYIW